MEYLGECKQMKALILNSGMGKRMGVLTNEHPKCMIEIGERETILSRQLKLLEQCGITDVIITTGFFDKILIDYCNSLNSKLKYTFIKNPLYDKTNYIYSMFIALKELNDDIILMHGDLHFNQIVLENLMNTEESSIVVDTTLPLPEKDFKAEIDNGFVKKVATYINNENCVACQPLYRLKKFDWLIWAQAIKEFCNEGNTNVYAEEALNTVLNRMKLKPIDLKGKLCMEVDTIEDLELLKSKIKK